MENDDLTRKQIRQIIKEYSSTPGNFTQKYVAKKNKITQSQLRSLIQKAIKEHILTDEDIYELSEKSSSNSYTHVSNHKECEPDAAYNHNKRAYSKYNLLRKEFLFNKTQAKMIVLSYLSYMEKNLSKDYFCADNCIDEELLDKTIIQAIVFNCITNKTYYALRERILLLNPTPKALSDLEKLDNYRNEYKKSKMNFDIHCIYDEISLLF